MFPINALFCFTRPICTSFLKIVSVADKVLFIEMQIISSVINVLKDSLIRKRQLEKGWPNAKLLLNIFLKFHRC